MSKVIFLTMYYKQKIVDTNFAPFYNIQCGAENSECNLGMENDNSGINISSKNKYWSEITGIYWFYKNNKDIKDYEYIALNSYRRFFNFKFNTDNPVKFSSIDEVQKLLTDYSSISFSNIMSQYDAITPIPYTYRTSIWNVCKKNYNEKDFIVLKDVIRLKYPDYLKDFNNFFFKNNKMIGHNMFVMKTKDFTNFCEWVFDILFEVERKIDPSEYNVQMIRVFGYMHEVLLHIYIQRNMSKVLRTQLCFADKKLKGMKFNSRLYRFLCNVLFFIEKNLIGAIKSSGN